MGGGGGIWPQSSWATGLRAVHVSDKARLAEIPL
jgi:hypothetical protein